MTRMSFFKRSLGRSSCSDGINRIFARDATRVELGGNSSTDANRSVEAHAMYLCGDVKAYLEESVD